MLLDQARLVSTAVPRGTLRNGNNPLVLPGREVAVVHGGDLGHGVPKARASMLQGIEVEGVAFGAGSGSGGVAVVVPPQDNPVREIAKDKQHFGPGMVPFLYEPFTGPFKTASVEVTAAGPQVEEMLRKPIHGQTAPK